MDEHHFQSLFAGFRLNRTRKGNISVKLTALAEFSRVIGVDEFLLSGGAVEVLADVDMPVIFRLAHDQFGGGNRYDDRPLTKQSKLVLMFRIASVPPYRRRVAPVVVA